MVAWSSGTNENMVAMDDIGTVDKMVVRISGTQRSIEGRPKPMACSP